MITEKHLYLAKEAFHDSEEGSKLHTLAEDSIVQYCIQECKHKDTDKIVQMAQDLITGHVVEMMINDGILNIDMEEDGDFFYLTEKGEGLLDEEI